MEKGFVYIGRLVDPKGNFVTNYYKLGKSTDFKVRETSLNSTHMPLDVQFIRVFETNYMSNLEKVLHACFDEYRVIKEYGWRRNITTEWFDVSEEELLVNKIDVVVKNFPQTSEVDLINKIESDTGTTVNQKVTVINNIKEGKRKWKLLLTINGEDVSEDFASETMVNAFSYICNKVGFEIVDKDEMYLSNNKMEMIEQYKGWSSFSTGILKEFDGYFLMTGLSNKRKCEIINGMIKRYNLREMVCEVVEVK
jgi:hypothetical protein